MFLKISTTGLVNLEQPKQLTHEQTNPTYLQRNPQGENGLGGIHVEIRYHNVPQFGAKDSQGFFQKNHLNQVFTAYFQVRLITRHFGICTSSWPG
jgi:hypothetical protein